MDNGDPKKSEPPKDIKKSEPPKDIKKSEPPKKETNKNQ
jgi:hypothetical protein